MKSSAEMPFSMKIIKKLLTASILTAIPILVSGYGYMGNLPELGEKTKPEQKTETQPESNVRGNKPTSILIPRPTAGRQVNKYSAYIADVREVYDLLSEIRGILRSNHEDKIQLFCAKVNVLNLYVDSLEKKYSDRPEKYYESYKQLVVLDKYLTEIVDFKRGIERYRKINRITLDDKLENEKYLKQKVEKAIIPINTIIEIIDETG